MKQKSAYGMGTMGSILFWAIYALVGVAAWYHTFTLFVLKDPPLIAGTSALAVDGVLLFTLYIVGRTYGDQKKTGLIGIVLFAIISAAAQVASRNYGKPGLEWVALIVDYLLPATVTFAVLLLGFIKYFDQNSDGVPDFMQQRGGQQRPNQNQQQFRPPQESRPANDPYERDSRPREVAQQVPPRPPAQAFPAHLTNQSNGQSREDQRQKMGTEVASGPKLIRPDESKLFE